MMTDFFLWVWNMGLMTGLTFLVLLLLRPVTGRLLRRKHQAWLWLSGFALSVLVGFYDSLGTLAVLPVSFRSLVVPRMESVSSTVPGFFPFPGQAEAGAELLLPLGGALPLPEVYPTVLQGASWVWLLVSTVLLVWLFSQENRLMRMGQQGERMDETTKAQHGIFSKRVAVRLCDHLPTSFVRYGYDTGLRDGIAHVICIQRELTPEQLDLVLRHELVHIQMRHPAFKCLMTVALVFYWWNPMVWLAYWLSCRDMELACDEAVMEQLPPARRKEYARALVELAAGKPLWGGVTTFGECETALRVRRLVSWKEVGPNRSAFSLLLTGALFLFFFCGGSLAPAMAPLTQRQWDTYVSEGQWVALVQEELEQPGWQPQEVWSNQPQQLVVQDSNGQWYALNFYHHQQSYRLMRCTPMRQAFLDEFQQIPLLS